MLTKGYILHRLCSECNKPIKTSSMTLIATIEGSHIKPVCDECYNSPKKEPLKKPDHKKITREEYMEAIYRVYKRIGPFRPEDISKELTFVKKREVAVHTVRNIMSRYYNLEMLEGMLGKDGFIRYYPAEKVD